MNIMNVLARTLIFGLMISLLMGCDASTNSQHPQPEEAIPPTTWKRTMEHGDVSGTRAAFESKEGTGETLRVDYDFPTQRVNHIGYEKPVAMDLSAVSGLAFQCKAVGDPIRVYLIVTDNLDRRNVYWALPDTSELDGWTEVKVDFQTAKLEEQGHPDFTNIRKLTLFLLGTKPSRGTIWFSDVRTFLGESKLDIFPKTISPNGDGVYDSVSISGFLRPDSRLSVDLLDAQGRQVSSLAENLKQSPGSQAIWKWGGKHAGKTLPEGHYQLRMTLGGKESATTTHPIEIISIPPWPAVRYDAEPFFPVGLFMHLSPEKSNIPADETAARAFVMRHFKRIAEAGFNTVVVAHPQAEHLDVILATAEELDLKVILDAMPLIHMQYNPPYKIDEMEAFRRAKRLHEQFSRYDSFARYTLYDEPGMDRMPSWLVLQRIVAAVDPQHPVYTTLTWPQTVRFQRTHSDTPEITADIYPFQKAISKNNNEAIQMFSSKLSRFLELAQGRNLWLALPVFSNAGHRYPTPEELRCSSYLALARGVKGLLYFTYFGWPDHADKVQALTDSQGEPTGKFAEVASLARELSELTPLLLGSTPDHSVRVTGQAVVGSFVRPEGQRVIIIVNPSLIEGSQISIEGLSDSRWQEMWTDNRVNSPAGKLTCKLSPGGVKVLINRPNNESD
jgi:hypothetical protein